jgi:lipopolysaccharide transport system ATP-binding protein
MAKVIKVDKISKQYRLGLVGSGALRDDVLGWWSRIRGKEDPILKIGETNNRSVKGESNYVWSLKDISFEVEKGEVLGIIGKNGAGKSTLLKILSKVTGPTTGIIKTKGRIASLLEVGTGFHPELTGIENIFLNGAILGMKRAEIRERLQEIISFAGIERYADTPVKRYSSGMYVRLAFAVAAHLEPEILIVDEVLAVGDADFQKKCIGKMKDVSEEGRTILFVSHNMTAVKNLCTRCILLSDGEVEKIGPTDEIIQAYLNRNLNTGNQAILSEEEIEKVAEGPFNKSNPTFKITEIKILNEKEELCRSFDSNEKIILKMTVDIKTSISLLRVAFDVVDEFNNFIITAMSNDDPKYVNDYAKDPLIGVHEFTCEIPANLFGNNTYYIGARIVNKKTEQVNLEKVLEFDVTFDGHTAHDVIFASAFLRPKYKWGFQSKVK